MAKEEKSMGLGEISTIRNILMGNQMQEYEAKFETLKKESQDISKSTNEKVKSLEAEMNKRFDDLEKDLAKRMNKLEQILIENKTKMEEKIVEERKGDQELLGHLFKEISEKLLKKK